MEENLAGTYIIRLFAAFEAAVRSVWEHHFGRDPDTRMVDILTSLTARCHIPADVSQDADDVRAYRNRSVHEAASNGEDPIPLDEACSRLCRFFSWMPEDSEDSGP